MMQSRHPSARSARAGVAACLAAATASAAADVVTDWNAKANEFIVAARAGPAPAHRMMALAQVAVFDAVNAVTGRYPGSGGAAASRAAPGASVEAAVASAMRGVLARQVPQQQAEIETAYRAAMQAIPDGAAKRDGVIVGEQSAAAVLARRGADGANAPDSYRPFTVPPAYVPTTFTAGPHWGQRQTWVLASADQLRPPPPPALDSATWARDYNEIKALGGKTGSRRSTAQTEIARFWEATLPVIYHPLARAVALQPGREVTQNARLLAAVTVAMDDALIAVFDAKYTYNFWRPSTAIRNGDRDGNDATERDPAWAPFIDSPMHPEYPCAHCVLSASMGAVLQAEIGNGPVPPLSTTSSFAPGVTRSWTSVPEFTQEVADARVYEGVHYRNSTEVGSALGRQVGEMVVSKMLR